MSGSLQNAKIVFLNLRIMKYANGNCYTQYVFSKNVFDHIPDRRLWSQFSAMGENNYMNFILHSDNKTFEWDASQVRLLSIDILEWD